ncbi:MAG TPA: RHS repeat domain-containing protein, partial [Allosphingosinicella sp.]
MKTSPYRVRAFACALLATTATCGLIAQPAQAQTPGSGPPLPATVAPDAAGIDLLNGRRVGVDSAISIGSPDAPALEFSEGGGGFDGTPIAGFRYLRGNYPYLSEEYYLGNRQEYNRALGAPLSNGAITGVEGTNPVVYDKDGSKWKFAPTGNSQSDYPDYYLVSITRADGEVLSYNYASIPLLGDIRNKLRSIVSSSGFEMRFEWGAAGPAKVTLLNRKLVHCAPLATSCSGGGHNWPTIAWSQDTSGSVSATTSGARTITYGVKQQGAAVETTNQFTTWEWHSTITSGSGVTRTYTTRSDSAEESTPIYYGPTFFRLGYCNVASRVWRVQSPAGTWNYNYTLADNANTCADIVRTNPDGAQASRIGSTFYDELGRARTYVFRGTPGENGRAKDIRTVSSITQPEGDKASFVYDDEYGRLNLQSATLTPKPTLGAPTLTWAWSYPASCTGPQMVYCNKPSYELDAKGNRTDYTYDPVHGGVLTKTLPAGSNGVRPQIRYTYQQLSAKVLNASGQLVEEAPIWKLVSTSQCRTQASCQGTADEVVTSYTYNDLLLPETETVRGGDWSVSSVVRKTYDAVGNIVAVDGPLAGTGDTTRYVYDALRRLVATMSPDPDGGGPLPVRVMRTTYNSDGQPTSVETGTAIDQSDAALAAMTVYRQIGTAYDAAGRKVRETVSAGGITQAITHYSYDNVGRLQCTAVRMDLADANALTLPACTPDLSPSTSFGPDRITKNSYDAAGQLIKVTEAYGTPDQADEVTNSYTPNGKLETLADGE